MKKVCNNSKLVDADLVTFRNTFGCENKFFPNDIVSCFGYGPFKVKHILGLRIWQVETNELSLSLCRRCFQIRDSYLAS